MMMMMMIIIIIIIIINENVIKAKLLQQLYQIPW